jgi:hypothetical protein
MFSMPAAAPAAAAPAAAAPAAAATAEEVEAEEVEAVAVAEAGEEAEAGGEAEAGEAAEPRCAYRCAKCRQHLFSELQLVTHEIAVWQRAFSTLTLTTDPDH